MPAPLGDAGPINLQTTNLFVMRQQPPVVGCYDLGGVKFCIYRMPSRFQRWWVKRLLGWDWAQSETAGKSGE
jgi:hypothetical protein